MFARVAGAGEPGASSLITSGVGATTSGAAVASIVRGVESDRTGDAPGIIGGAASEGVLAATIMAGWDRAGRSGAEGGDVGEIGCPARPLTCDGPAPGSSPLRASGGGSSVPPRASGG